MPRTTLDQLRVPVALVLLVITGFIFFPRGGDSPPTAGDPTPSPTVVVGSVGGEVLPSDADPVETAGTVEATPPPTPAPTPPPTPAPTPPPTPAPTPPPNTAGGFEVFACRSISGSSCNGPLGTLPAGASTFTALVTFERASAGDTINVILTGPAGTIPGGAYTLQGSGRGYYYSTFQAGSLPGGDYTLTATRNGAEVAVTTFRKAGG